MLALATGSKNRTKIGEKSHVFWNVDFKRTLASFWEAKAFDFHIYSMFFRCKIWIATWKGKKSKKKATKQQISASWRRVGGGPQAPGERKREGSKSLTENLSLASGAWPFVISLDLRLRTMWVQLSTPCTLSVGGGLNPPGGDHRCWAGNNLPPNGCSCYCQCDCCVHFVLWLLAVTSMAFYYCHFGWRFFNRTFKVIVSAY